MVTTGVTAERWVEEHPYLQQMARFVGAVERVARTSRVAPLPVLDLEAYAAEYARGVPLLHGSAWSPELAARAGAAIGELVATAADASLPPRLRAEARALRDRLGTDEERTAAARWVVAGADDDETWAHPGLLRFLGWTALRQLLAPALEAFTAWRDEQAWRRPHCPTCGALPAMAQVAGAGAGLRWLSCGCCRTRWRYRRIGCPYCENEDPDRLGIIELEGEESVRIDVCENCDGYLKTYVGAGEESVLLADWPTIHLDVLAAERGFKRLGKSLHETP